MCVIAEHGLAPTHRRFSRCRLRHASALAAAHPFDIGAHVQTAPAVVVRRGADQAAAYVRVEGGRLDVEPGQYLFARHQISGRHEINLININQPKKAWRLNNPQSSRTAMVNDFMTFCIAAARASNVYIDLKYQS
jgi:hypothetical protein